MRLISSRNREVIVQRNGTWAILPPALILGTAQAQHRVAGTAHNLSASASYPVSMRHRNLSATQA